MNSKAGLLRPRVLLITRKERAFSSTDYSLRGNIKEVAWAARSTSEIVASEASVIAESAASRYRIIPESQWAKGDR